MLPESVTLQTAAAVDCLAVLPTVRVDYDASLFSALARSVVSSRQIEVLYFTAERDATTSRTLAPYHLMLRGEDWYVIAHDDLRDEVRLFAVQRFRSIRETGATFERPADFNAADYMSDAFRAIRGDGRHTHHVVLHVRHPTSARIAEKIWHPSPDFSRMG
jgi:predicted DNA-binding transcriptional regulator YafY